MPELAAAPAFLALALLLWLMCEAVVKLLQAIAAALGTHRIGPISIPIGRWFASITSGVTKFFIDASVGLLYPITAWMIGIPFVLKGLFSATVAALGTQAGQIAHLYNTAIPQAGAHAQGVTNAYTNQEVGALGAQASAAWHKWDAAHTATDAANYVQAVVHAPTVENDLLAIAGRALLAGETYAAAQGVAAKAYTDAQVKATAHAQQASLGAVEAYLEGLLPNAVPVAIPGAPGATGQAGARGETGEAGAAGQAGAAAPTLGGAITIPTGAEIPAGLTITDVATGAVAAVGTAVAIIAREFESCAVTSCDGPNNLSNLLQGILGLAGLLDFAQFLDDATHPGQSVVKEYADKFAGIVQPLVTGGGDIWTAIEQGLGL